MAEIGIIASVIGVAGAGFRLSLILNAVGVELATADVEIQSIARGISLFSLMLKQVGITMEGSKSIASQSALDTAKEITNQSQLVFDEIKNMVEMVQKRDDKGNIRSITVAQRVKWCFKKQRVQYLLGQLESLKLSLSIMLQTLQLGKRIAEAQQKSEREMLQERAEIQNMVVVRHWALVDLRRLYDAAEHEHVEEVRSPIESPPPSYSGVEHPGGDPRLAIEPAPFEFDNSKALVKYQETPLTQLDSSMDKAMARPNDILRNPDVNVVDYLLEEWTRLREIERKRRKKNDKYGARYETDESDVSSEGEFERSVDIKGRYITNGTGRPSKNVKNVRFRARVEDDAEESDTGKPRNRPPSRHILRSDTSSSSSSSPSPPPPRSRRSSDSNGLRLRPPPPELVDRTRRPYTQPRDSASDRPGLRGGPPSPNLQQVRGMTMANQQWQGTTPQSPGVKHPAYNGQFPPPNGQYAPPNGQYPPQTGQFPPTNGYYPPSPGPQRMPSSGPYAMQPQGYGSGFQGPPRGPPPASQQPDGRHHHHHHHPSKKQDGGGKAADGKKGKSEIRGVKRGLLGAGAVAGLLDLLGGLDAI